MKKVSLLVLFATIVIGVSAQTADEVVNKFLEASGGKDKLASIKTLQYRQLIKLKLPMGQFDVPLQYFKEKNKFFRVQSSIAMGGQSMSFFTLVTDTAGYNSIPPNPFTGAEGGIEKMSDKVFKSMSYQTDPAGLFAPLVDYAAKGSKVELLKDDKVNKEECYKLKLTSAGGQETTFLINKNTYLVARVDAKGEMAANNSGMGGMMAGLGGKMDKMEVKIEYTDYTDVGGLKFPTKALIKSNISDSQSEISDIQINKEIDPRWLKAQ